MMNNCKNEYLLTKTKWTKIPNFRPKIYTSIFNFRNIVETVGDILTSATLKKWYVFCYQNCSDLL